LIFTSALFLLILENSFFFSKLWRAIPDVVGRQLSEAKPAEEGGCSLLPTAKYEQHMVKTDRDNDVTKWRFSIICKKCQVGDVTVGGGRVAFTSGFLFPVVHDLNRSTCRCEFFVNAYFWLGERRKIAKKYFGALFWLYFLQVWRAILDVHGRQLSEAKLAKEGRCVPLPTTKFEPLLVVSDRVISA